MSTYPIFVYLRTVWCSYHPLELVTVVDGFKTIGTMQICVSRMFQESTIFFLVSARVLGSLSCPHAFHQLLTILMAGFVQAMYALDAADGSTDNLGNVSSSVVSLP